MFTELRLQGPLEEFSLPTADHDLKLALKRPQKSYKSCGSTKYNKNEYQIEL